MTSQIGINVLAIAIFSLTLSILVGPWVGIAPQWPALVTVVALGLVTGDTLLWQGRGITLGLDALGQLNQDYRQRLAVHEAGHFLVAYVLDIPITGYTLSAWATWRQGYPGISGVQFGPPPKSLTLTDLDRYCILWMAGGVAETLLYGSSLGGQDDRQKLHSCLQAQGLPIRAKEQWAVAQATQILQQWPCAHQQLTEWMLQGRSVADCCQLLGEAGIVPSPYHPLCYP